MDQGKNSAARFATAQIDGLPVSCVSANAVLAELARSIEAGEAGHYVCVANTESMYQGQRDAQHRAFIRGADFNICDGVGVRLVGSAWGASVPRITGPSFMLTAAEYGVSRRWRHFFYGGADGVAVELARRLQQHYPGLDVCGTYSPPFRNLTADEQTEAERLIMESRPDIVWVGLGLPRQERWIAGEVGRLDVPWMIGVGAAFIYHSGALPWAPKLIRAAGLEWLYTLIQQPRRRARRYLRSLIYIVLTATKGLLGARFTGRSNELP